jgi:hypothetical protein
VVEALVVVEFTPVKFWRVLDARKVCSPVQELLALRDAPLPLPPDIHTPLIEKHPLVKLMPLAAVVVPPLSVSAPAMLTLLEKSPVDTAKLLTMLVTDLATPSADLSFCLVMLACKLLNRASRLCNLVMIVGSVFAKIVVTLGKKIFDTEEGIAAGSLASGLSTTCLLGRLSVGSVMAAT